MFMRDIYIGLGSRLQQDGGCVMRDKSLVKTRDSNGRMHAHTNKRYAPVLLE